MTSAMRIVAVDDEPIALDRVTDMLTKIADVELVGALRSGREAIDTFSELRPDLLLLDIEMPRVDGFDVVEALLQQESYDEAAAPLICFVTAFPQFAFSAYETGALDFLCKPVRLLRLEKAIARARTALEHREAAQRLHELSHQLDELRNVRSPQQEHALWVQQRGEMMRLDATDLDWVKAEGEYVRLHFGDRSFLIRSAITRMSEELRDLGFVRVHRSILVNPARLRAVRSSRSGTKLLLRSGLELPVGRKFRKAVEDQLAIPSRSS